MKKYLKIISLFCAATLVISSLSGCTSSSGDENNSSNSTATSNQSTNNSPTSQTSGDYDYSKPVPKASDWVKKAYFSDAVFVGDSVSTGISIYEYMENSTVYAAKGINPENIFTKQCISSGENKITIMQALSEASFKKVYILLGANAAEYMTPDNFKTKYGEIIDKVKVLQPEAKIYIQSVFPITKTLNDKNTTANSNLTMATINAYNQALLSLANEKKAYYVNVAEALSDENGFLPTEYSPDGIHINASRYQLWFDYLRTHTVGEFQ
ncbi:MAG: GDSL-type esterase/lipase family protein [Oscillospiraceae bacterium]